MPKSIPIEDHKHAEYLQDLIKPAQGLSGFQRSRASSNLCRDSGQEWSFTLMRMVPVGQNPDNDSDSDFDDEVPQKT